MGFHSVLFEGLPEVNKSYLKLRNQPGAVAFLSNFLFDVPFVNDFRWYGLQV